MGDPTLDIVGHSLHSQTVDVVQHRMTSDGFRHVNLIDTPGFEDSHSKVTDVDVVQNILSFLERK